MAFLIRKNNLHNNVCDNKGDHCVLRGEAPQARSQCLYNQLRDGIQPLPSTPDYHEFVTQSAPSHLPRRSDMFG